MIFRNEPIIIGKMNLSKEMREQEKMRIGNNQTWNLQINTNKVNLMCLICFICWSTCKVP